jgi:hypothetical protein
MENNENENNSKESGFENPIIVAEKPPQPDQGGLKQKNGNA